MREVSPRGFPCPEELRHPAGPDLRELHRVDARRGAAEEGAHGRGDVRVLPHPPPRAAPHRSPVVDRPQEHRRHVHQVPRGDRGGAPQDHQGRAVGEGSQRPPGVSRLPPASQGAEGLLRAGDGGPGLPHLPSKRAQGVVRRSLAVGRCRRDWPASVTPAGAAASVTARCGRR